jgi:hypothetical protein
MSFFEIVTPNLITRLPDIAAWLFGLVMAIFMLRKGGGPAEKLLLAGCVLMAFIKLASPFLSGLVNHLAQNGWSSFRATWIFTIPSSVFNLAGLICLLVAFILQFLNKRREPAR